ncbi:grasp-with-spasm system SPASM domain peptide maturase [Chryseobacterium sp. SIMBA_028]|uniref:grasp-with-spasm system SPASM domain peptide maturase n=1 Tax=Chryseobacterium sp. SIMBA_028 TaxID=3085771 RepID=UPI00397E1225
MKYFNLFSTLLITKGAGRILISDLQRNVSELYPLELNEMIEELKHLSIEEVLGMYDKESKKIAQKYLDVLLENEYGFITDNDWEKGFPALSHEYFEPSIITDLFIEMTDISLLNQLKISIEHLEIKHLVIYSSNSFAVEDFIYIDKIFKSSVLSGIEIFSPFHERINNMFIQDLNKGTERLYSLIFYNCPKEFVKTKDEFRFALNFVEDQLKISSCGKVEIQYFNTNLPKVLEALNHNSCLHKKIGIDKNGQIKNCPLMQESFGSIRNVSLEEVLQQPDFKKYWNLTKDHIEVCKDCEFRYICTDCRAYTESSHYAPNGLDLSKPLKCGYNPYTNEWEEWSNNPLKQKAIHSYSL